MRWLFATLLLATASAADGAEIRGRLVLEGVSSASVAVGYLGKTAGGAETSNMCGSTMTVGSTGWVQCDTFAPRVSRLEYDAKGARYRHSRVAPGQYLVWARAGEHWYTFRRVTLKRPSDAIVDFRVNPAKSGTVEAMVSSGASGDEVVCEPIGSTGSSALEGTSAGFWFHTEQAPKNGRVLYDGLKPGRYLLRYGRAKAVVNVLSGKRVRLKIQG